MSENPQQSRSWHTWVEFVQVIAVLSIGAGVTIAMLNDAARGSGIAAIVFGVIMALLSLRLVHPPEDVASLKETFEVTETRVATLRLMGTPDDVLLALNGMRGDMAWSGTAAAFQDGLYKRLGVKRGADYIPQVLPYLAAYDPPSSTVVGDAATAASDIRLPISAQPLSK